MLDEKYRTSDGVAAAHSIYIRTVRPQGTFFQNKIEKILKGSLNLIPSPSPSVKIQIMGGKICFRCKGKTLGKKIARHCHKTFENKTFVDITQNILPYYFK